eukprot:6109421-Prymnesium_polylepis.1
MPGARTAPVPTLTNLGPYSPTHTSLTFQLGRAGDRAAAGRARTPTRSEFVSRIHTSIRTVLRLFRTILQAVSRYFASFAVHKICGCFARVSRVIRVSFR